MLHQRAKAARPALARSGLRFLARLSLRGCELSILVVGDAVIRRLNRQWRKKDLATDVLSFPAGDAPAPRRASTVLGDVVISFDTAARRARRSGVIVQRELDRYLAHGLLHLLGYDHQAPAEAREMAALEEELLGERGLI